MHSHKKIKKVTFRYPCRPFRVIRDAEYLHDYLIKLTFHDNTIRTVDLKDFFTTSKNKLINKFAPLKRFKKYRIDKHGVLCWGDNECDIDPWAMYEGKFDAK